MPLESHNLAAALSHVETRQVKNDYTLPWEGGLYQIEKKAITPGLRRAKVRVEQRLDGSLAVRFGERYLPVTKCDAGEKSNQRPREKPASQPRVRRRGSDWFKGFDLKKGPELWRATKASGYRTGVAD